MLFPGRVYPTIVSAMAADDLATQGTGASAAVVIS